MTGETFVGASEIAKLRHTRVFEVSDELAATALTDWSPVVQVRLEKKDDGTYDLVVRRCNPETEETSDARTS
jgi:hypothetical protein